jgi:hypothetical protein
MELTTLHWIIGGFAIWMVLQIWGFISKRRSGLNSKRKTAHRYTKKKHSRTQAENLGRNRQQVGPHLKMWKPEKSSFGLVSQTPTKVTPASIKPGDVHNADVSGEPEMGAIVYTPDNLTHFVKRRNP